VTVKKEQRQKARYGINIEMPDMFCKIADIKHIIPKIKCFFESFMFLLPFVVVFISIT